MSLFPRSRHDDDEAAGHLDALLGPPLPGWDGLTVPLAPPQAGPPRAVPDVPPARPLPPPQPPPRQEYPPPPPPGEARRDRDFGGWSECRHPQPVADWLAKGFTHLFVITCAYDAAPHATPIPCGSQFRDPDARSFRALRNSAFQAGWHLDGIGRMVCPSCQQSADYRPVYPVTFYHPRTAAAQHAAAGKRAVWVTAGGEEFPVPAGFDLVVIAEQAWREDTLLAARHGRHAGVAR
jgi:hypothetical protein